MVKRDIEAAIRKELASLGLEVNFTVDYPRDPAHGSYATNAAMVAAKASGQKPHDVASSLSERLLAQKLPFIERIEVAGPGFINFHLKRTYFSSVLEEILTSKTWGTNDAHAGRKVLMEYTSPNLFKPLHIGNLIGNVLGESFARLHENAGADVVRINYPSDIGLTVAKGVWGLVKLDLDPTSIEDLGKAYVAGNAAYEDGSGKGEIEEMNRALYENSNLKWTELRKKGIQTSLQHLDGLCKTLGTTFDREFFESESGPLGAEIVRAHIGKIFEMSDGAVVYRGEQDGLHTRVFLNAQGLPTYEAKDLGLLKLKLEAHPDFAISVTDTGPEQKEYFKVLFAAARRLFPELTEKTLIHTVHGYLKLTTGKMSSRLGNVITGESLLAELRDDVKQKMSERKLKDEEETATSVAVAALKYAVLKQGSGRDIVFDSEKSISFEGDSGPYLQYAHVRACAIERKAKEAELLMTTASYPATISNLEMLLIRFPEVAERATLEFEPHYLTTYLTELAGAFNSWYAVEHVVEETPEAPYKLAVVGAFRTTMEKGLHLLGIKAPEEM